MAVIALALLCAAYVGILRDVYITRQLRVWHDNLHLFTPYHLAFVALRTRSLPLWSAEMNAGEPLWPTIELHPAYDPVALTVYAVTAMLGGTSVTAFTFVLLAWLIGFAFGGWLLARLVPLRATSALLVFIVLLWSSLGMLTLRQGTYLVIARWVPLAIAASWWFVRKPSLGRAGVCGLALGLALCGYQTAYLVVYGALLLAAAGAAAVSRLPKVPIWAVTVAVAVMLAIAAPMLVAAPEWLTMVPVGRTAIPFGTRGQIMRDLVWPLLGRPLSESALYVGIVPSILAVGAGCTAAASQIVRFWLRLLLGTLFVFLGGLEMLAGRDQPVLFIRNWAFFLPFVLLATAMLAGLGLDRLCDILRGRRAQWGALGVCALTLLDLGAYAAWHHRQFAVPRTPDTAAREPSIVARTLEPQPSRIGDFPIASYAPFHKQGPAVWGIAAAYLPLEPAPFPWNAEISFSHPRVAFGEPYTFASHWLELPRYYGLTSVVSRPRVDCVTGVTCPIVRLVPETAVIPATDFTTALRVLTQLSPEELRRAIVVEGWGVESRPARTDEAEQGVWAVRDYGATRIAFDVQMPMPGLLYYADGHTDDWTVTVDGRPVSLYIANYAFKAVPLPAGTHKVLLMYRPWTYLFAFAIRILGVACGVGLAVWATLHESRREACFPRTSDGRDPATPASANGAISC